MAILKSLVSVAWADGHVAEEEREVIEALLQAFDASPAETQIIRDYAAEPKSLDDVPVTDLSSDDRRVLLQHAVLLSYIDGEQHETELQMLKDLSTKLRIPEGERDDLMKAAGERAKSFLNLLLDGGRSAVSPRPSAVSQTGGARSGRVSRGALVDAGRGWPAGALPPGRGLAEG